MENNFENVPKSNIGRKRVIWKSITITDIIFVIIFAAAAFSLPFPIPGIPILAKILMCVGICIICGCLLIKNKVTGLRAYQSFWLILKYLVTKKKYNSNEMNKTVSQTKLENGYVKQSFKNKEMYLKVLKIHGFDLLNSNFEDQLHYLNTFHSILLNCEKMHTLIKIKEMHDWDLNIKSIYNKIEEMKINKSQFKTKQEYKAKLNQLRALIDFYLYEKQNNNHTANSWYLIVFGNTIDELEQKFNETYFNWNRLFFVDEININQTIQLLKNIWEPLEHYVDDFSTKNEFSQFPDGDLQFYSDQFRINKSYFSIGTLSVDKFPLKTDLFWLNRLSRLDNTTMIINLNPIENDQAKRIIQRSINNSAYLENQFNEYKQAVLKSEFQQQMAVVDSIKETLATGREILINTNIYFLSYGNTASECKLNTSYLKTFIKNENMVYNNLMFRQKDFFVNLIPNGFDDKIATESIVFPAGPLAGSFPIMDSIQIDETGCYLGINTNNNPVVVDVNLRNNKRINSNGLVLGNTGSGKTTTVKKILNNHLANDGIAFVLDPEQDYIHLTKYYDGKIVDAANGNKARINPLQILLNESDDENNTNNNLISTHLTLLLQWFRLLELNFSESHYERIKQLILGLYKEFDLFDKNLYNLAPSDYPTFKDLCEYISQQIKKTKRNKISDKKDQSVLSKAQDIVNMNYSKELIEILEILMNNFLSGGIYDSLYNGHSILKIGNDPIIDFDVKNLLAISSPNRKVAQLLLIIAYIQNAINLNGYNKNPKKALLIVDEAHLFIDAKYPDVLIFLSQMSKRIRKRSGGVWITTQNPSDFIATDEIIRYTRALMENTQYTIIQALKPNDANAIVEMYKNTPNPITEPEKQFIQSDKKGQALVIISNKMRQCVEIDVFEEEFKAIGHSPTDKFDISQIDMSIDFDNFTLLNNDQIDDIINEINSKCNETS